jgi:CBS domain-containing protein
MSRVEMWESEPCAADVMTSPAVACSDEATIEEVAELRADREISGVPVVEANGSIVGIITERDLARVAGGSLIRIAMGKHMKSGPFLREVTHVPHEARVAREVMTTDLFVATPKTPLHVLAENLVRRGINRIPIVEGARLVGVVTRGDVLSAFLGVTPNENRPPIVVGSKG